MNSGGKPIEIRQEAFSQAREKLGLSIQELALKACLSNRQIQQIENGEHSSFYSHAIKLTAAKKVAALLELSEIDAFDSGVSTNPLEPQETQIKSLDVDGEELPKTAAEKAGNTELKNELQATPVDSIVVNTAQLQKTANDLSVNKSKFHFLVKPLVGVSILAIFSFAAINLQALFFSGTDGQIAVMKEGNPSAESHSIGQAIPVTIESANPISENANSSSSLPAQEPVVSSGAILALPASSDGDVCPKGDGVAESYRTNSPRKAGDMVYVLAKKNQVVCAIDGSGKRHVKELSEGMGSSFYGNPPFKLLTHNLNEVDVYFQGMKVRPEQNNLKTIILEEVSISVVPSSQSNQAN